MTQNKYFSCVNKPARQFASVVTLHLDYARPCSIPRRPRRVVSGYKAKRDANASINLPFDRSLQMSRPITTMLRTIKRDRRPCTAKAGHGNMVKTIMPIQKVQKMTVMQALGDIKQSESENRSKHEGSSTNYLLKRAIKLCQLTSSKYGYDRYL